jgi:hypothetical protein
MTPSRLAPAALLALLPGRGEACALALLFALDVSASVDAGEYALQRDGLAAALLAPEVEATILAQPGGVALAAYEWSGRYQQQSMLGWTLVTDRAGLLAAADAIAAAERGHDEFPTAIGYALGHGAVLMRDAPACRRRVIDVSGDGIGNEGFPPASAYEAFDFAGITVNGLVIGADDKALLGYYRSQIPHGPGAFVETAAGFSDYEAAMRRKLMREILGPQMAGAR